MSTTPNKNQSEHVNPYSAPKSLPSTIASKVLTVGIVSLVIAVFASAGAFAYWRYASPQVIEAEVVEEDRVFLRMEPEVTVVESELSVPTGILQQP
jgi:hypothetical protein